MTTILVLILKQRVCRKSYSILTSCFGESNKYRHLRPSPGQEYEFSFILTSLGNISATNILNERWGVLVRESTGLIIHSSEGARGIIASKKVQEKSSHYIYIYSHNII
jgi:hypothetical protein